MEVYQLAIQAALTRLAIYYRQNFADGGSFAELLPQDPEPGDVEALGKKMSSVLRQKAGEGLRDRYYHVVEVCSMGELARTGLDICLAVLENPELSGLLKVMGFGGITLEAVSAVLAVSDGLPQPEFAQVRQSYRQLSEAVCVQQSLLPFYRYPLAADERLLAFLVGDDHIDKRLEACTRLHLWQEELQPLYTGENEVKALVHILGQPQPGTLLQILGGRGSGKKLLLRHACRQMRQNILFVNYRMLCANPPAILEDMLSALRRETIFYEAVVCFTGIDEESCPNEKSVLEMFHLCVRPLEERQLPICFATRSGVELVAYAPRYLQTVRLEPLARSQRIAMWEGCCKQYGLKAQVDCMMAATKYQLSAAEIHKAVQRLASAEAAGAAVDHKTVAEACDQVLPPPGQGSIRRICATFTLDDLKLPSAQKRTLQHICDHVLYRYRVYDTWGMERKFAYGRSVSALFVGSPGTGKTMAVHVLSNLLDLPLYRVDLSQVVDKYIGETEKKLEDIFSVAEKSNTILFFDEADSIFGKRSEVSDAKDKYANTEVSYILQRMELYDGIVILATNYKKNIDEAFMRRMRYVVEFPLPGPALRLEIWQSAFAPQVPLQGVDFEYLSRQFELSGGSIKNIVLNATFLAAARDRAVCMKDILESTRNENIKMGKAMLLQDFGQYGALMAEEL